MARDVKKRRLSNSNVVALGLLTLLNVSAMIILYVVGQFGSVKADIFQMGIYITILVIILFNLVYVLGYIKGIRAIRKPFMIVITIFVVIMSIGAYYSLRVDNSLSKIIDQNPTEEVSYSLITMKEDNTTQNVESKNVGYIQMSDQTNDLFVSEIQSLSRTANTSVYENNQIYTDLVEGKIDYAIVPESFKTQFREDEHDIKKAHVLKTFKAKIDVDISNKDIINEPFSVLVLGNNEGLSDSIMVVTINPKTLTFTMTSFARDSYVERGCRSGFDKLNHNRGEGRECITNAIENMLGIEIDYYFETDFYALVKIVDALDGIELTSELGFSGSLPMEGYDGACNYGEPEFDEEHCLSITIHEGTHLRNGNEAITFARERHAYDDMGGDMIRQQNQQYVIQEVASKILATRNIDTLVNVLAAASENIKTNLSVSDLSSLMGYYLQFAQNSQVSLLESFRIYQSQVVWYGSGSIIDGVWYAIVVPESLAESRALIHWNLQDGWRLMDVKGVEFSVNSPYEFEPPVPSSEDFAGSVYLGTDDGSSSSSDGDEEVVQKPDIQTTSTTIPDLLSMSESARNSWASANGISISYFDVEQYENDGFEEGQLYSQSTLPGTYDYDISVIEIGRVTIIPNPTQPDPESPGNNGDGSSDGSNSGDQDGDDSLDNGE